MRIRKTFGCAFLFLSIVAFTNPAPAQQSPFQSNCEDVKKLLSSIHPIVEWGPIWGCRAPDVAAAMFDASLACANVVGHGSPAAFPGNWQIWNWVDVGIPVPLPPSYLGYCAGISPPGVTGRTTVDAAKASEARKKIQDALDALGKKN
jgi:hypothetical protein